ncbi:MULTISPECIES: alpha/beta hydrolase [unclassified Frankia]|uniref:alpha/beta hydrolase n=1 Tax=unclassified Frankia TaxID=2632575 RepID=UPI002AD38F7D|nr:MULTISPECIES: alpha/beta hydrolase [unclassified Frankia]
MSDPASCSGPRGVLLVHGAWFTGRAWDGVADALRARGIPVAVAELHRGCLAADIAAAEAALDEIADFGPAVACGHSYGGSVISGLSPGRLAHLVYLAAMVPDVGETSLGLLASAPSGLETAMVGDPDEVTTIDPARAGELFFAHLPEGERTARVAALVPQRMAAGRDAATSAAWRARPSTYVVCGEDRAVHPELQARLSRRTGRAVAWASDHAAFASHPTDVVDLLSRLATSESGAERRGVAGEPARGAGTVLRG